MVVLSVAAVLLSSCFAGETMARDAAAGDPNPWCSEVGPSIEQTKAELDVLLAGLVSDGGADALEELRATARAAVEVEGVPPAVVTAWGKVSSAVSGSAAASAARQAVNTMIVEGVAECALSGSVTDMVEFRSGVLGPQP